MKHPSHVIAACGCQSCVNGKKEKIFTIYNKKILYFFTETCREEFLDHPQNFLDSNHFKITFESLTEAPSSGNSIVTLNVENSHLNNP